ncbi:MAG TPA: DUF3592 domain-containing protein [Mucilaginibacter sp.]
MSVTFNEIIGLLIGALFIIWAFGRRNHRVKLLQTGVTVEGKVIRIERVESTDSDGTSYRYTPVIEFPVSKTETIAKTSKISTYPCPYKVDDKVAITYDPVNIDDFTLNDGPVKTLENALFAIGVIALIYAAVQFIITR